MMTGKHENYDYLLPPEDIRKLIKQKFKDSVSHVSRDKIHIFYFKHIKTSLPAFLQYNTIWKMFNYENNRYTVEEFRRILNLLAFA